MLERILLPVDFSERSLGPARYAAALAGCFGAEITLLHVLEPMRYEFSTLEFGGTVMNDLLTNRAEHVRAQLEAFLAEELAGARVTRVLLEGDPAQKIVRYAHGEHMDLIVVSTHGYGTFRRFILGSVTAKVLHDADCPVLTGVHLEAAPAPASIALRTILCAVDLGPQSRKALIWAAQLASEFQGHLTVVHAVPALEITTQLAQSAKAELAKLCQELSPQPEVILESGDPPKAVCRAAEHARADLLVIGRGSAAGIFGRLRTNAYAIIRQSPCPVVSV
jgi:nucleotide-binding universal stress UspA family protein